MFKHIGKSLIIEVKRF